MAIRMRISALAKIAGIAVVTGFIAVVAAGQLGLHKLKVGGAIYEEIMLGNELVADILPPPAYIIESYLVATLALNDPKAVAQHKARIAQLRKDYEDRHAYWLKKDLGAELNSAMTKGSYEPAMRFYSLVDSKFIPAIERGDLDAARRAYSEMAEAYGAHRQVIDRAVELAGQRNKSVEQMADQQGLIFAGIVWAMSIVGILIAAGCAFGVLYGIMRPVNAINAVMARLATGDLDVTIRGTERQDEIGEMARSVDVFLQSGKERRRLEGEMRETRDKEIRRQKHLESEVQKFRQLVATVIQTLNRESESMRSAAHTLTEVSQLTANEAGSASRAASGAAYSSQAVVAATEELGASIKEISEQAHRTSAIVAEATDAANQTDRDVAGLAEAAQTIGSIVETIRAVAEQTNLLALNATIEAARAGEAGKGFAVVAAEVKTLAAQTAKATEQIAGQIAAVQGSTRTAVESLKGIATKVEEINGLTGAIAAAVEEQDAATREIATNVTRAADESKQAADNANGVTAAASRTKSEAQGLSAASDQLSTATKDISNAVNGFLTAIAADLDERRKTSRRQIDWAIVITRNGRRHEVRAYDASTHGIRVDRIDGIAKGDRVSVEIGSGPIPAEVIWSKENVLGLRFDTPLAALPEHGIRPNQAIAA
jgi:methyl-accepting chemotaxis protein